MNNIIEKLKSKLGYKEFINQLVSLEYGEMKPSTFEPIYNKYMDDDNCTKIFHINKYCNNIKKEETPINDVSKLIDEIGLHKFIKGLIVYEFPELNNDQVSSITDLWYERDQDNIFDIGELVESIINNSCELSI
ncbi:hypothetical protein KHQ81_15590 (plasmid) [Mycoplasmatota bacterium]|nr:hypothetical protein KHQ81_15590 [Mycoplasmatota bacterium]